MKKTFYFASAIASIIGLFIGIYSLPSNSVEQNINGKTNNVVGENKGSIIINNYDQPSTNSSTGQYRVKHPAGGGTFLSNTPSIFNFDPNKNIVCQLDQGTTVTPLGDVFTKNNIEFSKRVRVENGSCSGKIGWVSNSTIEML